MNNFKMFDKVVIKYINKKGYIDAITIDKYRVCLNSGGYEWVDRNCNAMAHDDKDVNEKKALDIRYLR